MNDSIVYLKSVTGIIPAQLKGFCEGWTNPPAPRELLKVIESSAHYWLAFDRGTRRVVGLVTCLSDGFFSASIPLLEVLPEYRKKGIGTELMRRMLKITANFYMVDLSCDESLIPFYEKLNFERGTSMRVRNHNRQPLKMA
ncbi:MAG TPA: GNAT family N-acetyltransferase [Candidatus Kapabacteria bacterium]|nr:GNAT family N-acetyltransferase [Candidatus Kapabacteria bacterium]